MPKAQFRNTDTGRKISRITFGVESAESMQQTAHMQVVAKNLYNQDNSRTPVAYGVLDRHMGTSQKDANCLTCEKDLRECTGHFGYLDLELPVFHVGYFTNVIQILQSICKKCSHVLLTPEDKIMQRLKIGNPDLNYVMKKVMRKKILIKVKKVSVCPNCREPNGVIKKVTPSMKLAGSGSVLKILHETYRNKKEKESCLREQLEECDDIIETNPELKNAILNGMVHILTPIEVLRLFEMIPDSDIPLLLMDPSKAHPKDLILTRMLVPPVCIRPSVVSSIKSGTNEDDLTMKQSEIVFINHEIYKNKISGAPVKMYQEGWDFLQLQTALYINSELSGIPQSMMPKKPGRGLVQRIKGKQGRFRGNLSGKRVDFTARTVISPDPHLEIDQVGVPIHVAKILTYPERVTKANLSLMRTLVINGPSNWPGANYVQQKNSQFKRYLKYGDRTRLAQELKLGDLVERHLKNDDIVLFNRQPSLHKQSIMAHRVKVHNHRTLRFNESVCNPYNADFDGDEMNLHLPQTEEAKAEALILMGNKANLVTPKNGEILIAPTQDFLTGSYLLTRKNNFLDYAHASQLLAVLCAGTDATEHVKLPVPAIVKPRPLWTGKQIFSAIFRINDSCPVKANLAAKGKFYTKNEEFCVKEGYVLIRNSELIAGTLDKSHLGSGGKAGNIFFVILRDFGVDHCIKAMWRCGRLTSYYLMNYGFSIGVSDVTPCKTIEREKQQLLRESYSKCDQFIGNYKQNRLQAQAGFSPEETLEDMILKELSTVRDRGGQTCLDQLPSTNSPLIMTLSGSKGSMINISQMIVCVGQQALSGKRVPDGFEDRSLPHFEKFAKTPTAKGFVANSFYSGLTMTEFFFHTMGGREGLVDTAVKTAETGYMQRRLVKSLEDLVVHYDGTVRNAEGDIIQLEYGCDSLDPLYMEGNDCPVDFKRIIAHVRACHPFRNETSLTSSSIQTLIELIFDSPEISQNDAKTSDGKSKETKKPGRKPKTKPEKSSKELKGQTNFNKTEMKKINECAKLINECKPDFKKDLIKFLNDEALRRVILEKYDEYKKLKIYEELQRFTLGQCLEFLKMCANKYTRAMIEPGTAVGAIAAQSIGEPGTQMTLKTFHFAGVASMNITQGVPRIKEIMNASTKIQTPVISAELQNPNDMMFAQQVKGRLEKTMLPQICVYIREVYIAEESFVMIKLDLELIALLQLEVNIDTVIDSILASKLKLKPGQIETKDRQYILIHGDPSKYGNKLNFYLSMVKVGLSDVVVKGLKSVNRAVINPGKKDGKTHYHLFVEGDNLREVIATYGVKGTHVVSNNTIEVFNTLGIEAARLTIVNEIAGVMKSHGMLVDHRHILLLAAQMTHTGEVCGITRHGLAKMKQSVLNLASFERTSDHLFEAAYYGQTDKINGVSENIITGLPAPIGTGIFKLLHKPHSVKPIDDIELLLYS